MSSGPLVPQTDAQKVSHSRWAQRELTPADLWSPHSHTMASPLLLSAAAAESITALLRNDSAEKGANTCYLVENAADGSGC